jgi:uncharacterized membrane protein
MASASGRPAARVKPLAPDSFERILAWGSVVLLLCLVVALARGRSQWGEVPPLIWIHLATIALALALTPVLLLQPRGVKRHRQLGTVWVAAMIGTAIISLFIRESNDGSFSFIHIISAGTLILVPRAWWAARNHQVAQHRSAIRGIVTGALLIAGFFTFPFNRLLGQWLFH